jgi:hypothetical protein
MMIAEKIDSRPNEHIFVVTYEPHARVLDLLGTWTELLSDKLELPKWAVVQTRLDVFSEKQDRRAFISFRDYGVTIQNTTTRNFFPEFGGKFLKCLSEIDEFRDAMKILRIGVRSRFCTPAGQSFASLRNLVLEKYVALHPEALPALGSDVKVLDVGAPLNFEDKLGSFNTQCGPMKQDQLKQFFDFASPDALPQCGLYFDIDYFRQPNEPLKIASVVDALRELSVEAWDKHSRVRKLILGD